MKKLRILFFAVLLASALYAQNLFTLFQQQLGLKLESTKAPADVLVIDRAEKPSEN
jgi:uncharacterized protein (TIGR03435 family)